MNPAAGGAPFVCSGQCVGTAGKCTTNADCCAGLPCATLPGSSSGTCGTASGTTGPGGGSPGVDGGTSGRDAGSGGCSLYGQTCSLTADCCNGVPCTNGRCAQIIF